jgi:hypothetical protein
MKKIFFITKTRNLKRAAQALPQRQRLRGVCAACAPREHEIYIILFRVFTCPVKPFFPFNRGLFACPVKPFFPFNRGAFVIN